MQRAFHPLDRASSRTSGDSVVDVPEVDEQVEPAVVPGAAGEERVGGVEPGGRQPGRGGALGQGRSTGRDAPEGVVTQRIDRDEDQAVGGQRSAPRENPAMVRRGGGDDKGPLQPRRATTKVRVNGKTVTPSRAG